MSKFMRCVTWEGDSIKSDKYIKRFIEFPKRLYSKDELMRNQKTEEQLLTGNHTLSKYVRVIPYLVIEENEILARAVLTYYNNDRNAYIGFFECIEDRVDASGLLFNTMINKARQDVKFEIIGPVDVSFWIGYRMKVGYNPNTGEPLREPPYTNEPYNNTAYFNMWKRAGFEVCDEYYSNHLRVPTSSDANDRFIEHIEKLNNYGYELVNMSKNYFDSQLIDIYNLMLNLYNDFPCYKYITEDDFYEMFNSLKYVLDFDMVKLAYYKNKLVAFLVSIPNYKNLINKDVSILDMLKINIEKHKIKEYVILYMGVDSKHLGVGAALAELMRQSLEKRGAKSIEALIHSGKISGSYYRELVYKKTNYVLLKKTLYYSRPY